MRLTSKLGIALSLVAGFHVVLLASPATALAQPSQAASVGNDFIYLKNGGMLRGTLLEAIPTSHATIKLDSGATATVRWAEIDRIDQGGAAPVDPSQAPPLEAAPMAIVHIESESFVTLQRARPGTRTTWDAVCASPCNRAVPLEGEYRIAGDGTRASASFALQTAPGHSVVLTVTPRSGGLFALGIVGTAMGGLAVLTGISLVLVGAVEKDVGGKVESTAFLTAGWASLAVGTLALVGGVLLLSNAKTRVEQELGAPRGTARAPVWREASVLDRGMPRALVSMPLLSGSF